MWMWFENPRIAVYAVTVRRQEEDARASDSKGGDTKITRNRGEDTRAVGSKDKTGSAAEPHVAQYCDGTFANVPFLIPSMKWFGQIPRARMEVNSLRSVDFCKRQRKLSEEEMGRPFKSYERNGLQKLSKSTTGIVLAQETRGILATKFRPKDRLVPRRVTNEKPFIFSYHCALCFG